MGANEPDDTNDWRPGIDPETVESYIDFYDEYKEEDFEKLLKHYNKRYCSIRIDCETLKEADEELYEHFEDNPDDGLAHAEAAFVEYAKDVRRKIGASVTPEELEKGYVRFENFKESEIRSLRSDDLNKPVTLRGVVSKRTDVNPRITKAMFRCQYCHQLQETAIPQEGHRGLREPNGCVYENCNGSSFNIEYDHPETEFIDRQAIRLQERPEGLKGGERPQEIEVRYEGDITGDLNAGDRVTVTGILRAEQKGDNGSVVHKRYMEGLCFNHEETDFEDIELDDEDGEEIEEMVARFNNPIEAVVQSIAPSIHGYPVEKRAVALQLFGGVTKHLPDDSRVRGDIHLLLIGDPGTGKSQILQYVGNIAPRSVYSSGKGSSAAGLTAAAVRDDFGEGNEWTLEAGALVLADKGLAAIDELDKMRSEDRSSMHQALEQQEISVAKAGINATLKSRCSLLGAANPRYGRFDPYEPIGQQIDLEPALISRFDLIFTIMDEQDDEDDEKLADHILQSNHVGQMRENLDDGETLSDEAAEMATEIEPVIDADMLRKYVAYAKNEYKPEMDEETKEEIKKFYTDFRKVGEDEEEEGSPVAITPRQLEAAVRLAEASARIRLSNEVTEEDAKQAVNILKYSLRDVGYDPENEEFDVDRFSSSMSTKERNKIKSVKEAIKKLMEENEYEGGAPLEDIVEMTGLDESEAEKRLNRLSRNGELFTPTKGGWDTV